MLLELSSIWVTVGPVLVINAIFLTSLAIFAIKRGKLELPDYLKGRHTSRFLGNFLRHWWFYITEPIAKFFVKIRLTPNIITFIGFLVSLGAAYLFSQGLFGYAGWVMVYGATFDMFDGMVARITGRSSRSGAYFDSVIDRFSESATFLGLAIYWRASPIMLIIIILALIGSTLVSYTRARGEGVGVVCKKGSMQRPERITYLGVAAILQPVSDTLLHFVWANPAPVLVIGALIIIAVMTNVTAIHRMIYIMNELDTADRDQEEKTIPQVLSSFSTKEGRDKWWLKARYGYDRSQALKKLCILILVDGANEKVFDELMQRGDLPNISRYIIEVGTHNKAVSTFPSTTGPAFTPIITGCFAGTCDIPGIRWFDRRVPPSRRLTIKRFRDYYGWGSYALDFDLSKEVRTIFEYSRKATNILGMLNRGTGVTRDPAFFKIPLLFYKAMKGGDIEATERSAFRMFVHAMKRAPDFIFYYFPTVDKYSHQYHGSHEIVYDAYRRLDTYVGKMVDLLKSQKLSDDTMLILTSDHGHSDVDRHFDLDTFLEERFKTLYYPNKFKEWASAEAVNMVSGNSMSNIYLKNGGSWEEYNFFEDIERRGLIEELLGIDAVDIIGGRSAEGGVIVKSRRGSARIIEGADGRISYRVMGADPFGYGEMPHAFTGNQALEKTWDSPYPDGIVQAAQIFRSGRSGDLVVSAAAGYDLRERFETPPHFSTHGALRAEHMFVPFCINSKVPSGSMRTADVFPTILRILGIVPQHRLDGRSLI